MRIKLNMVSALTIIATSMPAMLAAQELSAELQTNDTDALGAEIQTRYDAALVATSNDAVVAANDARYMWASEAKVQCAIALGYLKSNTRDEVSISKCDYAFQRMTVVTAPPPPPPPPPPPAPQPVCTDQQPGIVFFEFDSDVPGSDAAETIRFVAENAERCDWDSFTVVGHTDRAGSDSYNMELSMRRAQAVADLMESLGIPRSQMSISAEGEENPRVPTEDGVRSPQNRRVEVTVTR